MFTLYLNLKCCKLLRLKSESIGLEQLAFHFQM